MMVLEVDAVMLTGGTSKARASEIQRRLTAMATSRRGAQEKEIKLCYVTVSLSLSARSKPLVQFALAREDRKE